MENSSEGGLFALVKSKSKLRLETALSDDSKIKAEIDSYLNEPEISDKEDPISYWKQRNNNREFPSLTSLAKTVLAMPASSGGVERLFSVAGAISRSRRSRLTVGNIEKLLLCRNYYMNQGNGK
jgi:hypothetical protein